jgi:hypothetical protein
VSGEGVIYRLRGVDIDGGMVKVKVHAQGWNIPHMVVVLVGEQDCLELVLRLKGQTGGKPAGIYG